MRFFRYFFLLPVFAGLFSCAPERPADPLVLLVCGDAVRKTISGAETPLAAGTLLPPGDSLRTGPDDFCVLQSSPASVMTLFPDSHAVYEGSSVFTLHQGKVHVEGSDTPEIRTSGFFILPFSGPGGYLVETGRKGGKVTILSGSAEVRRPDADNGRILSTGQTVVPSGKKAFASDRRPVEGENRPRISPIRKKQQSLSVVEVSSPVTGSGLWKKGDFLSGLPVSVLLDPGRDSFTIRTPGFRDRNTNVVLKKGGVWRWKPDLLLNDEERELVRSAGPVRVRQDRIFYTPLPYRIACVSRNPSGDVTEEWSVHSDKGRILWLKDEPEILLVGAENGISGLDPGTGRTVWTIATGPLTRFPPETDDGKLWFSDRKGYLHCREISSGAAVWHFRILSSAASSPVNGGDGIYFSASDGGLFCLDEETGTLSWRVAARGQPQEIGPLFWNGRVFFFWTRGRLVSLNNKGRIVYNRRMTADEFSSAVWDHGRLIAGFRKGEIQSIQPDTGRTVWRFEGPAASPVLASGPLGALYAGFADGSLVSLSRKDGSVLRKFKFSAAVKGIYFSGEKGYVLSGESLTAF